MVLQPSWRSIPPMVRTIESYGEPITAGYPCRHYFAAHRHVQWAAFHLHLINSRWHVMTQQAVDLSTCVRHKGQCDLHPTRGVLREDNIRALPMTGEAPRHPREQTPRGKVDLRKDVGGCTGHGFPAVHTLGEGLQGGG